jgi:two-component system, response regulator PdtaR
MSDLRDCVLVVEDEILIAELWCMILEDLGVTVCGTASTAAIAIALAEEHRPRIILMDVRLKGPLDGIDAAIAIHASVGSKIIFLTGSREQQTLMRIQQGHPTAVLFKPVSQHQLQTAVEAAMQV